MARQQIPVQRSWRASSARPPAKGLTATVDRPPKLPADFAFENINRVFGSAEQVLERRWNVREMDVPYRWISHWDRERLLLDIEREGAGWRKFSFVDYVWVRIVCELRSFGLSFPAIRRVKATIGAALQRGPRPTATKTRSGFTVLLLLIADAVAAKRSIHVLVRPDGDTLLAEPSQSKTSAGIGRFRAAPYVCIPLTEMLGEIIRRNAIDFIVPKIPLLSTPEFEVLTHLRAGNLNLLQMAVAPGADPVSIATGDRAEAERALLEGMMLQPYRQIRYVTTDGKAVTFSARART